MATPGRRPQRKGLQARSHAPSPRDGSLRPSTAKLLRQLKARLRKLFGARLVKVIIFGSEARGDARPDSDIDLMVVLDPPFALGRDLRTAIEAIYPLQLRLDRCIHSVVAPREAFESGEYALYRNAREEGLAA